MVLRKFLSIVVLLLWVCIVVGVQPIWAIDEHATKEFIQEK